MSPEPEHAYGPRVHLVGDACSHTAPARLGSPGVTHTERLALVRGLYRGLAQRAYGAELPTVEAEVPTRMAAVHRERGVFRGRVPDPAARVVVVDVIRGGIVPAQVCFETLTEVLPVDHIRLDHLNMSRRADERGRVTGVDPTGSKVGGSTAGATLVLPDPVGATGSTLLRAVEFVAEEHGRPAKVVCLPLIVTPEFLRRSSTGSPKRSSTPFGSIGDSPTRTSSRPRPAPSGTGSGAWTSRATSCPGREAWGRS